MLARTLRATVMLFILCTPRVLCQPAIFSDSSLIAQVTASLQKLMQLQKEVGDIHPFLHHLHPVAVVERDSLFIFDADPTLREYRFQKKEPVPFPMVKGIRPSFPLECYGGKPTCVVSREVFDSMKGYVTVFHEFVHCTQFLTCENALKQGLRITREAAISHKYSWEINHAFPYEDTVFVKSYAGFLEAVARQDTGAAFQNRRSLKQHLSEIDHEYLVWVEWKEGFARFIENEIRSRYGIEANEGGKDAPYNRVTFYFGGERFIRFLIREDRTGPVDVGELFRRMSI